MSRIRGRGTKPENQLAQAIGKLGVRYRRNVRALPGRPDIANTRAKVAVFVDGCFWHGCPRHFRVPRTRAEFWAEKIRRNQATRQRTLATYSAGWSVFQVYECELRPGLSEISTQIAERIRSSHRKI